MNELQAREQGFSGRRLKSDAADIATTNTASSPKSAGAFLLREAK